jgi:hypothetical protein
MKAVFLLAPVCLFFAACTKQDPAPAAPVTNGPAPGSGSNNKVNNSPSDISVSIDNTPMAVTAVSYDRSSGTFNFSAWNKLQKVDVYCFWFYQQSRWNYQYSDSINYSTRPDTVTNWTTTRAIDWGEVYFDCCQAPLTDTLITGTYSGNFLNGKQGLTIKGDFHLLF